MKIKLGGKYENFQESEWEKYIHINKKLGNNGNLSPKANTYKNFNCRVK